MMRGNRKTVMKGNVQAAASAAVTNTIEIASRLMKTARVTGPLQDRNFPFVNRNVTPLLPRLSNTVCESSLLNVMHLVHKYQHA